jgi:hypothetical protein
MFISDTPTGRTDVVMAGQAPARLAEWIHQRLTTDFSPRCETVERRTTPQFFVPAGRAWRCSRLAEPQDFESETVARCCCVDAMDALAPPGPNAGSVALTAPASTAYRPRQPVRTESAPPITPISRMPSSHTPLPPTPGFAAPIVVSPHDAGSQIQCPKRFVA